MSYTDEASSSTRSGWPGAATRPARGAGSGAPTPWEEIAATVRRAEPRVLFVEPRILRRVILQDCRLSGIGFQAPHGDVYTIERERLLVIVDRPELNLSPAADLPHYLILLPQPVEDRELTEPERDLLLWQLWRHVFHGRVHAELAERLQLEQMTDAEIYERVRQLGASRYFEIRQVLRRDELLLHDGDVAAAWTEFVAVSLELRYFAPSERPFYFPAIEDWGALDALMDADFPHVEWYRQTRPEGAPAACPHVGDIRRPPTPENLSGETTLPAEEHPQRLRSRAADAGRRGNQVQAVLLSDRLGDRNELEAQLQRLCERLSSLCGGDAADWRTALSPLAARASGGYRSAEAKLLYDLQKACVAAERGVYRFDVWGWISSGGKRPLRRPLPVLEQVLVARHIRTAAHRLPDARLSAADRDQLTRVLTQAEERAEEALRVRIRPLISAELDAVGLVATNLPEQVARAKIIEELLDHIAERGFLNIGDLRDALSQNQLKLADLGGLHELLIGDKLLRADRRLAASLEGVYRGGAVYLRLPQRLSSIAFGTPTGRFLVQYLVLPFGGSYLILEAVKHILAAMGVMRGSHAAEAARVVPGAAAQTWMALSHSVELTPSSPGRAWFDAALSLLGGLSLFHLAVFLCGVFLLLVYHWPTFRHQLATACWTAWRWSRWFFTELPVRIIRAPWVRWVLESPGYAVVRSYVFRPAIATAVLLSPFALLRWRSWLSPQLALDVFLGVNLFLNSPAGRYLEERLLDVAVRIWHELRFRFLAVAFQWIMDAFQRLMQALEQVIYKVDEWLRFQAGDPGRFVVLKLAIGLVWGVVAYVIRFAVTLLIEPQVNPIKHFPVVTVSHKILLPYTLWLKAQVQQVLGPGHEAWAATIATTIILLVPGMIGFLVWELKENWRLYETNRPSRLTAARIGGHGETLARLLRPGFHSGTLPKQFARLRHSLHVDPADSHNLDSYRHLAQIEEIGVSLRRFVDREFCRLLQLAGFDAGAPVRIGAVRLATQRVELTLEAAPFPGPAAQLVFEDRGGFVCAEIRDRGWMEQLSSIDQRRLANGLAGLFHLGGVELLSAELRDRLPSDAIWECTREELLARDQPDRPARYRLIDRDSVWLIPRDEEGRRLDDWPTLPADLVLLTHQSIPWVDSVESWQALAAPAPATAPADVVLAPG